MFKKRFFFLQWCSGKDDGAGVPARHVRLRRFGVSGAALLLRRPHRLLRRHRRNQLPRRRLPHLPGALLSFLCFVFIVEFLCSAVAIRLHGLWKGTSSFFLYVYSDRRPFAGLWQSKRNRDFFFQIRISCFCGTFGSLAWLPALLPCFW